LAKLRDFLTSFSDYSYRRSTVRLACLQDSIKNQKNVWLEEKVREEVPDLESSQMKETLWISEQDHPRSRGVVPAPETTSHSHPTSLS